VKAAALFPELTVPRKPPRQMMHVIDAGDCIARYKCAKCGAETGWLDFANRTAAKRGVPCESCNASAALLAAKPYME